MVVLPTSPLTSPLTLPCTHHFSVPVHAATISPQGSPRCGRVRGAREFHGRLERRSNGRARCATALQLVVLLLSSIQGTAHAASALEYQVRVLRLICWPELAGDSIAELYNHHHSQLLKSIRTMKRHNVAYEVGLAYLSAFHEVEHLVNSEKKLCDDDVERSKTVGTQLTASLNGDSLVEVKRQDQSTHHARRLSWPLCPSS